MAVESEHTMALRGHADLLQNHTQLVGDGVGKLYTIVAALNQMAADLTEIYTSLQGAHGNLYESCQQVGQQADFMNEAVLR